ncbi:uncharacterized transporter slc-17.2-like [Varroa jacobsoni]|uniref:uncharacterized transporter slc-17.2-like n=1 Tax=Varroa jacobsoni TaxID=62625 RepID=UPI000BF5C979|nr:uncharacterized transporter slc-17.2-like [Varroa jacobsoni]
MNRTVQNLYVTKMQTPIIEFGDPRQSPNSNSDPELLSLTERSRVEERDKCAEARDALGMSDNQTSKIPETKTGLLRHRYVICLLVFTGLALAYSMRINMSVAIIQMVGSKGKNVSSADDGTCPPSGNISVAPKPGEFIWPKLEQKIVENAFFVGYTSTQVLGGIMADKYSIKWVFGYGIFLTSVFTLITHWVARWSIYGLIALRAIEGITEGVTFPSVFCLMARWSPVQERTTMVNLCIIGSNIGTVITLPMAAALCQSSLGWPAAFYIPGALGVVWSVVWYICATSQPENHRWISDEERRYIIQNRGITHSPARKIPWLTIITSKPVWLFATARFCTSLTLYLFLTQMPIFIDTIFHISMTKNGALNALFFVCYACVAFSSGAVSDRLIQSNIMTRTNIRKLFECASAVISGVMLLLVTRIGCNWNLVAIILCCSITSLALSGGGNAAMALDLAPDLAGSVMGFGNTIGNCSGIVAPLLVGVMTSQNATYAQYNNVFYTTATISFVGAITFAMFATAEEQPWSKTKSEEARSVADQ